MYPPSQMERPPAQFAFLANQWRQALGYSHREFARFLARNRSEWGHYYRGRRAPSESFCRVVLTRAQAAGGPWYAALLEAYKADAAARVSPVAHTAHATPKNA